MDRNRKFTDNSSVHHHHRISFLRRKKFKDYYSSGYLRHQGNPNLHLRPPQSYAFVTNLPPTANMQRRRLRLRLSKRLLFADTGRTPAGQVTEWINYIKSIGARSMLLYRELERIRFPLRHLRPVRFLINVRKRNNSSSLM